MVRMMTCFFVAAGAVAGICSDGGPDAAEPASAVAGKADDGLPGSGVGARKSQARPANLTERDIKELDRLWQGLGTKDARSGERALFRLIEMGDTAASYVAWRLRQATVPRRSAPAALARLVADLDNDDYRARERGSEGLARLLAQADTSVTPFLKGVLKRNPSLEVRVRIEQLLRIETPVWARARREARAIRVLEGIKTDLARNALKTLPQTYPRVDSLIRQLHRGSTDERWHSLLALRKLDPKANQMAPALIAAMRDKDAAVRFCAAIDLGHHKGNKDAAGALARGLTDTDGTVRLASAHGLGRIGPVASQWVGPLLTALRDRNPNVRSYSAYALGRAGVVSQAMTARAAAALETATHDPDEHVRRMAKSALEALALRSRRPVKPSRGTHN